MTTATVSETQTNLCAQFQSFLIALDILLCPERYFILFIFIFKILKRLYNFNTDFFFATMHGIG